MQTEPIFSECKSRKFIEDSDTVVMTGFALKNDKKIGFS